MDFNNSYEIENSIQKYRFLIQKGSDFINTDYVSIDELLNILRTDGMMVKRPIINTDTYILVGFNEVKWSKTILE